MVDKPEVAVLVINFNGKRYLKECLNSLRSQIFDKHDVYLVDNGSRDGSLEFVKKHFAWVKIIDFGENLGFAKAYNEAIKTVDSNYIVLLNNDTRVDVNWLDELLQVVLQEEEIVAVGSKILLLDTPHLLNHAGAKFTLTGAGIDIGLYEQDHKKYNIKKQVGAVCGASMLIRKDLFLEIGGFDEDYFAYFEDADFCYRAWIYGLKVIFAPKSVVYHKLGGSWGPRLLPLRIFLGERNRLMTIVKNFEIWNLVKALAISLYYDLMRFLIFLKSRQFRAISAILRGNCWILLNLTDIIRKRQSVQANRKVPDAFLEKSGFFATLNEGFSQFTHYYWPCHFKRESSRNSRKSWI